jgi:hypothetical protein
MKAAATSSAFEWRHGMCFAPPNGMFHQHFDTRANPARYLAVGFGTKRYPIVWERRLGSEGGRTDVSIKEGGSQIEYGDQDPGFMRSGWKNCARPARNPKWDGTSTKQKP